MDPAWLVDGPSSAPCTYAFAHGAGAPMDSEFMQRIVLGLAGRGVRVVRFEFPYMAHRRHSDSKRAPERAPRLEACFREVVAALSDAPRLFIGGKSMGGRIATRIADAAEVTGVVCFGFPFHPPGKPIGERLSLLQQLRTPCLIVQGSRDNLGDRQEVEGYALAPSIEVFWLEDGDHSLKPRVRSGHRYDDHLESAVARAAEFMTT